MSDLTITVGGLPGTGSSTICRLLEQELGLPYVYAGRMFRQQAAAAGRSLAEYNRLSQEDPAIDLALDERQVELLRGGGVILEGRLSGWLAHRHRLAAFKVWVTCEEDERVRRLVARDGGEPAAQAAAMRDRVSREMDRYERYYGANLSDPSIYDLVLDSTLASPEELTRRILDALAR